MTAQPPPEATSPGTRHATAYPLLPASWSGTSRGKRIIGIIAALPGVLALILMLLSWLLPRTRPAVFLVLAGLVLLFVLQFMAARKYESGPLRAAMTAFSCALLYFAVFGVLYAEYANWADAPSVFSTDRLGEAFLLSTSIGTATGYVPGAAGAGNAGFLTIVHAQMVILVLGVATSVAGAMARMVRKREVLRGEKDRLTRDGES